VFPVGALSILLALVGWQQMAARLGRRAVALSCVTALLLALSLWTQLAAGNFQFGPREPDMWDYAMKWVLDNVPKNEAVCSQIDPLVFLLTGRQGVSDRCWMDLKWKGLNIQWTGRPGYCPEPEKQRALIEQMHVRWFLDVGGPNAPKYFGDSTLLQTHPDWFERGYDHGRGFQVYRLR